MKKNKHLLSVSNCHSQAMDIRKKWVDRLCKDASKTERCFLKRNGLFALEDIGRVQSLFKGMTEEERKTEKINLQLGEMISWEPERDRKRYLTDGELPDVTTVTVATRAGDLQFIEWCAKLPDEQQYNCWQQEHTIDAMMTGNPIIIALIEDRLDWYFRHMRKRRREQFAKQWEKKVKRPFDAVLEAKLIAAKHLDDDTDCDCFHCISNNNDSK